MSYLLTDPTAVVLVGGDDDVRERVTAALTEGAATSVRPVETPQAAASAVREADDVGCVVLLSADDVVAGCEAIHDANDVLPVVVHVAEADDGVVGALAERRQCRYLPRTCGNDRLRSVVDDALAAFEERRRRDAESSLFTTLLDDGDVTIYAKDEAGRHLYRTKTRSFSPDDERGKTDLDLTPDQFSDVARRSYRDDLEVVETSEPIYDRLEHYVGDDEFWVETTKLPWRRDGVVQGLVGVSIEVTEREECRRDLEREHQRVDRFVTYVSHDLRTPLQIAFGALSQAREGDEEAFERLERAHDRIQTVVADLGTLATGDPETVDGDGVDTRTGIPSTKVVPLIESVWESLDTAEATLDVRLPDLTTVVASRRLVRPLVENLLKNSLEHAGPAVTVRVGETRDPSGFYVADDGPGIPSAERDRVTDEGYTTTDMGTGTGLSIVRETVDHLDWDLAITDSDVGGARFEITDCHLVTTPSLGLGEAGDVTLSESIDVGTQKLAGRANHDDETGHWTVVAGGFNLWARTNEFHYVYGRADGPVRIQARVADFAGVVDYSKAGVMVRDGLDEDAAQAFVGTTEGHGTELLWRPNSEEPTRSDQLEEPDGTNWYRVDYADGTAVSSVSVDGKDWQPLAEHDVEAEDPVTVGLVVCSRSNEATAEATFADVTACRLERED